MRLQIVVEQDAVDQHRVIERNHCATFHCVILGDGFIDAALESRLRRTTVDAVGPVEEIARRWGRFEVSHGAHVDVEAEIGGTTDIKDPGSDDVSAACIAVVRVHNAKEFIGIASLDNAQGVARELPALSSTTAKGIVGETPRWNLLNPSPGELKGICGSSVKETRFWLALPTMS